MKRLSGPKHYDKSYSQGYKAFLFAKLTIKEHLKSALYILLIMFLSCAAMVIFYKFYNNPPQAHASDRAATENNIITGKKQNNNDKPKLIYNFSEWNKTCNSNLIVINSQNKIPDNFHIVLTKCNQKYVNINAATELNRMINDAKKDNVRLWISSGHRSVEFQERLFNRKVSQLTKCGLTLENARKRASSVVAAPRTSEHHTGLAIDFNGVNGDFYKTKEYKWLIRNSDKYGFILRYPKDKQGITHIIYEPWHFRYVGTDIAPKIKASGMCLEEYISKIILQ